MPAEPLGRGAGAGVERRDEDCNVPDVVAFTTVSEFGSVGVDGVEEWLRAVCAPNPNAAVEKGCGFDVDRPGDKEHFVAVSESPLPVARQGGNDAAREDAFVYFQSYLGWEGHEAERRLYR